MGHSVPGRYIVAVIGAVGPIFQQLVLTLPPFLVPVNRRVAKIKVWRQETFVRR